MTDDKRASLAFLSGILLKKENRCHNSIFDYHRHMHIPLNCDRNGNYLSIYDYNRRSYLTGNYPSFYDYASSSYLHLNIIGEHNINCYDYETASYANVRMTKNNISIYDYQTGSYYNYMMQ